MTVTTENALVLAGGGVAGIAWETGVLCGIHDEKPALIEQLLSPSTTFIGTSAGSSVAAQLAASPSTIRDTLHNLFARQTSEETAELLIDFDIPAFMASMGAAMAGDPPPDERRRRIGSLALAADTVAPEIRRAIIAARLPGAVWTDHPLLIPAIETATGELRIFDRTSGVNLVDAVTASCAVPGVWPPVDIDGRFYMDGGIRTAANADLAAGAQRIVILVPSPEESPFGSTITKAEIEALESSRVFTVFADDESIAAMGANPLDPSSRPPTALAGRKMGHRLATQFAEFWA